MDAFDENVLVCATVPGHELRLRVRALFSRKPVESSATVAGIGSVLPHPELLARPLRDHATVELAEFASLLSRLDLRPADQATAPGIPGTSTESRSLPTPRQVGSCEPVPASPGLEAPPSLAPLPGEPVPGAVPPAPAAAPTGAPAEVPGPPVATAAAVASTGSGSTASC